MENIDPNMQLLMLCFRGASFHIIFYQSKYVDPNDME